jgi:hypothetical protein
MKLITAVIFITLISSASAAGNWASQSNTQTAIGNGLDSTIDQDASNAGLIIGDDNIVCQSNDQFADMEGIWATIVQDSANLILILGDRNTAMQDNWAGAWNWGSLISDIYQTQDSLGVIVGNENLLDQDNSADATISEGLGIITQDQTNNGLQLGYLNELDQSNDADAWLDSWWILGFNYAFADAYAYADATVIAESWRDGPYANADQSSYYDSAAFFVPSVPYIDQDQTNTGIQIGNNNYMNQANAANANIDALNAVFTYADARDASYAYAYAYANDPDRGFAWGAYADAYADANAGSKANGLFEPVYIDQEQSNVGVQVGCENDITQNNDADASIDSYIWAGADARANAYACGYSYEEIAEYNCPDCDASVRANAVAFSDANLKTINIRQDQASIAAQFGNDNEAVQSNIANADIDATVIARAKAYAWADAYGHAKDFVISSCPYVTVSSDATADASAIADLSTQTIDQDQSNLAMQIGDHNDISQGNYANALIDVTAIADIRSLADAHAYAWGWTDDGSYPDTGAEAYATASANVGASASIGATDMNQHQLNAGLQVGNANKLDQSNVANTEVHADIESTFVDGVSDSSVAINPGYAYASAIATKGTSTAMNFPGGNVLDLDQANYGLQIGDDNEMCQSNYADLFITGSDNTIYIDQANYGLQIGDDNEMCQSNYADIFIAGSDNLRIQTQANSDMQISTINLATMLD